MYDLNHIYKVGNLISKLRDEKGLSQSELGSLLGVTNKAVSRWENGRGYPDTSLLLKLSDVLGITADELLKGELSVSAERHNATNRRINYEAEKSLFLRFSVTIIPFFIFAAWIIVCLKYSDILFRGLDYVETWFACVFLPVILSTLANAILGLLFVLKIHKRNDIKKSVKTMIGIAAFVGFGAYYIAIFIYMIVRLLIAKRHCDTGEARK